ncbi:MAG: PAS domain S-box protein [Vitreimonas sp.]
MSNVQEFPGARQLTEFEALVAAGPSVLEAMPGGVYLCDAEGWLVSYNAEAAEIWGRAPEVGAGRERYCGSLQIITADGTRIKHEECPMAGAVLRGMTTRNAETMVERPDGTVRWALVNVRPLLDWNGAIQGAINCFQDITAQKQVQQDLAHKSQELEDFFDHSAVALHIVSSDGIILRANQAELDLLGYGEAEYVGRHIAEFHADAPAIGEILQRLSCGERLNRYPARLRAKNGSLRYVLITSNSRFENGKFVNTRCFTTDISELRAAESARWESESRLAATYEAATVGLAEADEAGRLLRVNDALCRMLGRSRAQLLDMGFLDYTHPDDRADDAAQYARQVKGDIESYVIRKKAVTGDGDVVYLDVFSSSVKDSAGQFRYGVRVLQDVTEAARMEERLKLSEKHMRDLLEALPAAVYTTDADGRITFYNKAAVDMAGRTPQPGDEWCVTWRLYQTDGTPLPHDQCPMAIALRENRPVRGAEAIAERPDGTRVPFIPFPTPLHDANGKLVGAINMLIDISERKRAENRQKVLIDELNHRVKNTLATVQSLAAQTARYTDSNAEFVMRFEARLMALARAHDLLSQRHWEDAPLDILVRDLTEPLAAAAPGRVTIDGPSVSLNPRAALAVAMALNELLTNAAKYGALSSEAGSLALHWRMDDDDGVSRLVMYWRERGGPIVNPPTRRGFGTRLMERCIRTDLEGKFDLDFDPDGVTCVISIPIARQLEA